MSNFKLKNENGEWIELAKKSDVEEKIPPTGTTGYVLTKTDEGTTWAEGGGAEYTAGAGITIINNEIGYDPEEISSVEYVDANITDTMNFIIQERDTERAARIAGDNLKQNKLTAGVGVGLTTISEQDGDRLDITGVQYSTSSGAQTNALKFVKLTQTEYDALTTKDLDTFYMITEVANE